MTLSIDTPFVDPYWKSTDKKVFADLVHKMPKPASPTNKTQEFIEMNCQVAQCVNMGRIDSNTTRKDLHYSWKALTGDVLNEDWILNNNIKPIFRNISDVAKYVINDNPNDMHRFVDEYMVNNKVDALVINDNPKDVIHFNRTLLIRNALDGLLPITVNASSFYAKYYFKVPRPNKVIQGLLSGDESLKHECYSEAMLRTCVDVDKVMDDHNLFTLVPNTTPHHWSYPAMHSTNAGTALMRAAIVWDFEPDSIHAKNVQNAAIKNMLGRTILGVHTIQDNLAGAALGQAIAFTVIPQFMQEWTGANPEKVKERLKLFWIDYGDYTIQV